jgi:hypothetical protein
VKPNARREVLENGIRPAVECESSVDRPRLYDLITCVHGLHYAGDKLAALARAASWLTPGGLISAVMLPVPYRRIHAAESGLGRQRDD